MHGEFLQRVYAMATSEAWLTFIDQWEAKFKTSIRASYEAFHHEKYSLHLHLESSPTPFRPSSVLSQLIHSEQRRGISTKQQRQRVKNVEHLERKLESEFRQHYELEAAQACSKWQKLHVHLMEDRRQLAERLRSDMKLLYETISEPDEAERQRLLIEVEWIQQERFNIQEAFTNQTKKIQADYQAYIDQLDAEFITERQKILQQAPAEPNSVNGSPQRRQKAKATQFNKQFKSNAKRHMLVQTAPVVELHGCEQGSDFLSHSYTKRDQGGDMSFAQRQLQELEQRLAAYKEAADGRLKDGMQWIARQCAHTFSQLDCKEAEAKLVVLLTQQNMDEARKLLHQVETIASHLLDAVKVSGSALPVLPTLQQRNPDVVIPSVAAVAPVTLRRPTRRRLTEPAGLKQLHA